MKLGCQDIIRTRIAPPLHFEPALGILHSEEEDDHAQTDAGIQCCGENVVVSHPPSEVEATDIVIEDEADHSPRREVESAAKGNCADISEEKWDVNVSPERQGEATSQEVEWNWANGANNEEP